MVMVMGMMMVMVIVMMIVMMIVMVTVDYFFFNTFNKFLRVMHVSDYAHDANVMRILQDLYP